jgi:co-chaperonin GroES (HSP10)
MNIRPPHDKIWVKRDQPLSRVGLIYLPESHWSNQWSGVIVAIGPGEVNKRGVFVPTTLRVEDHVVVDTGRAVETTYGDPPEEYLVTREKEILGIISEGGVVHSWQNQRRPTRREWEETMKDTLKGQVHRPDRI